MVLPAYAGVILVHCFVYIYKESAPRVCGGDPAEVVREGDEFECSPRMRG